MFRRFFGKIWQLDKFERVDFKCDNRFLKFYSKNTNCLKSWAFLFFGKIFQLGKIEGTAFKYINSFVEKHYFPKISE